MVPRYPGTTSVDKTVYWYLLVGTAVLLKEL
eukprot:SAG11_NODE_27986_length_326_cov_1.414097_1_plen_30_part_01